MKDRKNNIQTPVVVRIDHPGFICFLRVVWTTHKKKKFIEKENMTKGCQRYLSKMPHDERVEGSAGHCQRLKTYEP